MKEFSDTLLNMLSEFVVCEIGSRALDGITYTLLLKNERDKSAYDRYMLIKKEAVKCGYTNNEVFRSYELTNGYIFDMDLNTVIKITSELAKSLQKLDNNITYANLLGNLPEQRRKKDIIRLAKFIKEKHDDGQNELEVALFSENSTGRIIINGHGPNNEAMAIKYNAYAIRHWDIELLNEKFLIPAKFRVKSLQACEVLPSKTGVSFKLQLEDIW